MTIKTFLLQFAIVSLLALPLAPLLGPLLLACATGPALLFVAAHLHLVTHLSAHVLIEAGVLAVEGLRAFGRRVRRRRS